MKITILTVLMLAVCSGAWGDDAENLLQQSRADLITCSMDKAELLAEFQSYDQATEKLMAYYQTKIDQLENQVVMKGENK